MLIALRNPWCQIRAQSQGTAEIHKRCTLNAVITLGEVCTDNDIAIAIAVHVTRRGHRPAELVGRMLGFRHQRCRVLANSIDIAEVNKCLACIELSRVVDRGADNDIVEAVSVHIPRRRDRETKMAAGLVAKLHPTSYLLRLRGAPEIDDRRCSGGALPIADNEVAVAVAVHIPCRGYNGTDLSVGLLG